MRKNVVLFILISSSSLSAQQKNSTYLHDNFSTILTDARAASQGDLGVATSADVFSQSWNPSKYVFSDRKCEIGVTHINAGDKIFNKFSQVSLNYYNKPNERKAHGFSFRGYAYDITPNQATHEIAIDGSYSLRLSYTFALSVASRFISLKNKYMILEGIRSTALLYGIDVSGFYYGNELAFMKFNGRWRAGFNLSNLRSKAINYSGKTTLYAPSTFSIGTGFDFIFNLDELLALTIEYKTLIDEYIENPRETKLDLGSKRSRMALGIAYSYQNKIIARTGYSYGTHPLTGSFASIGMGVRGKHVAIDSAIMLGVSEKESPIQRQLRLSLSIDLEKVLSLWK